MLDQAPLVAFSAITAAIATVGTQAAWKALQRHAQHKKWRAALVTELAENAAQIGIQLHNVLHPTASPTPAVQLVSPIRMETWRLIHQPFMATCTSADEAIQFASAYQVCHDLCIPLKTDSAYLEAAFETQAVITTKAIEYQGKPRWAINWGMLQALNANGIPNTLLEPVKRYGTPEDKKKAEPLTALQGLPRSWQGTDKEAHPRDSWWIPRQDSTPDTAQ